VAAARDAGAELLTLPHHLGLGGCVQAGYKLAYELGFEYVIRVDGDGQHPASEIPGMLDRLKTTPTLRSEKRRTCLASFSESQRSSASRKAIYVPREWTIPIFFALAWPAFACLMYLTLESAVNREISASELSVDPSFTITISKSR